MAAPTDITSITDTLWELPLTHRKGMRVPARFYATRRLLEAMDSEVFEQTCSVACMPGIVGAACCMPDGHGGYGFPIGGVAAFDPARGVISPGGIGFDINCGMRLVATALTEEEVRPRLDALLDGLAARIPAGMARTGERGISPDEFMALLETGARWCRERGWATEDDLDKTEEGGCAAGARAQAVSARAVERGLGQVGTLGSGNHYLEIQVARPENITAPDAASAFGIMKGGQVLIMFHCGSRGFGHQVATDYVERFVRASRTGAGAGGRELAAAPFESREGQDYLAAMKCAVNMAYANRQVILHGIREVFSDVFHHSPADLGLVQVYDVSHNVAAVEEHVPQGAEERSTGFSGSRRLLVHRKGATRALPPGSPSLPAAYRRWGQPVIIGGSMETGSWLLAGAEGSARAFHTTAHGSGRTMSRGAARKIWRGQEVLEGMRERGIRVRSGSLSGLAEEAGGAYKDIDEVVEATERAGLSRRVARLVPIGCIKG
jgi:tRNA-splicing ligase RtcB (3'-phosphate/5'-hydroxy nucleic acid ligase)